MRSVLPHAHQHSKLQLKMRDECDKYFFPDATNSFCLLGENYAYEQEEFLQ